MLQTQPGYSGAVGESARRFTLYADYTLMSDDTGRKGHGAVHQVNLNSEIFFGKIGRLGGLGFLEFADAPNLEGEVDNGALLEADFGPYWAVDIAPIRTTFQFGWLYETFPRRCGDDRATSELFATVIFDDSAIFKTNRPVFNPFVAYYHDIDDSPGGRLDFGISHAFVLSEWGLKDTPVLKNVAIIPSFLLEMDLGQRGRDGEVSWMRYGVQFSYDLSGALRMPPTAGRVTLSTFIYYRDSDVSEFQDRWFAGMTLGYFR